jgi:hypothetical protein
MRAEFSTLLQQAAGLWIEWQELCIAVSFVGVDGTLMLKPTTMQLFKERDLLRVLDTLPVQYKDFHAGGGSAIWDDASAKRRAFHADRGTGVLQPLCFCMFRNMQALLASWYCTLFTAKIMYERT